MYLNHFGLDSAPFNITSQTDFFYDGAARGATLDALLYAVQQGEGIVKVTGEVGSGKTMLCRMLLESLPDNVETIFLSIPSLKREEIVQALCIELGLDISGQTPYQLLTLLQAMLVALYAENKRVVTLIDEAHAMPIESLEEIRLLSNLENGDHKLLQIILFGQPELDDHLRLPHMRQLKERITHSFQLHPLVKAEVGPYLAHRLQSAGYKGPHLFSDKCMALITDASAGLTRRINIIADKSLLAAYADNTHTVTPQHVRSAIRDSDFALPPAWGKRVAIGAATVAAAAVIGFGVSKTNWLTPKAVAESASTATLTVASSGAEVIEGSPEWHEKNINKNNGLSKYVSDTAALAYETKIAQNSLTSLNSDQNLSNSPKMNDTSRPVTGFDVDSPIQPTLARPTNTPISQADASNESKNTLTSVKTDENVAKISQPDQSGSTTSGQKVAELKLSDPSATEKKLSSPPTSPPTQTSPSTSPSKWLQDRIASSKTWLDAQPASQCVIQLLMADISNHNNVEQFLSSAQRQIGSKTAIHVFPSEINGQSKYIVSYADTGMNCQSALEKLPAQLKQSKPYIRSVGLLRNEAKFPA